MPERILMLGLFACLGCANSPSPRPPAMDLPAGVSTHPVSARSTTTTPLSNPVHPLTAQTESYQQVSHQVEAIESPSDSLALQFARDGDSLHEDVRQESIANRAVHLDQDAVGYDQNVAGTEASAGNQAVAGNAIELNLPSTLAMIGGQHPVVGVARWRVQEAYARLTQAETLWLPSIGAGFSFHRHDGNYQASNGDIVDVDRNSFQYGLGDGATGAGTTPRPGLVAQFHLADAIFQPEIARRAAWADGHAAGAVLNQQLLSAAKAYLDLVDAHQQIRVVQQSSRQVIELAKITVDFADAGEGLRADADRLRTESLLVENRLAAAQGQARIASARLSEVLSIPNTTEIVPTDLVAVPIQWVARDSDPATLIATGLSMRPELKQSQALVAAACQAYRREQYAPFVPSMLLGFSTGGFGGGIGNQLNNISGRYDIDAQMSWQVRNLGFGERAAQRTAAARIQQAKFEKISVMDQVARQISEAHAQIQFRRQQIEITRSAIEAAEQSHRRNLERIRDGEGLPLEALQSVRALEETRVAYLRAVIDHNQAQVRLQWAQGWPVDASAVVD